MQARVTGLILFAAVCAVAQDQNAPDPPERVARLNWIKGAVSFQPPADDTWTTATVNYPLSNGDHLYTGRNARAEMHIGPNAIRLDEESNFGFLRLDDATVQMRFTEGAMEVRLRRLEKGDLWEVDTPNGIVTLLRPGDYRFDVSPERRATMVTVALGEAEILVNGRTFGVRERQTGYFSGGIDPDIRTANVPDQFDRFTVDRNTAEDRLPRSGHVADSMGGYEDLEGYGVWREAPDFGWVWLPPVDRAWVPYRDGRWVWRDPWGWTWVDDAPWGFAPFHYGRWAVVFGQWCWIPGPFDPRPVYAPALVVFVGGWGGGSVAWFPLGHRERYHPPYHVSDGRDARMNSGAPVDRRFGNRDVPGAVVAVPRDIFVGGRSVPPAATRVAAGELANARMDNNPGLPPNRDSRLGGGRGGGNVPQPVQRPGQRPVPDFSSDPIRRMDTRPLGPAPVTNPGQPAPLPGRRPDFPRETQPVRPAPEYRAPDVRVPQQPQQVPEIRQPQQQEIRQPRRIPDFRTQPVPQSPPTPTAPPAPAAPQPAPTVQPTPQPLPRPQRPTEERRVPKRDDHQQNDQ